jgi:glycerol-3-phosphate dehydrogenase (NAD(P)+)
MSRIAVLGSGAWGTAIALALHRRGGHQITLWSYSAAEAGLIAAAGENTLFLPGFPIPKDISITNSTEAVGEAEIVVSVIPSEFLRPTLARLRSCFHPGQIVVSATKGVENNSFLRMTEVIASSLGVPAGLDLGPGNQAEICQGTTLQAAGKTPRAVGQGFIPGIRSAESTVGFSP